MEEDFRIGLDLGGTKVEAIALDDGGVTLFRRRVATPADDYWAIVDTVCGLVKLVERELDGHGSVGIGLPGAISPTTGMLQNANTVCLNGAPFDRDVSEQLGRPIRVGNDANCFVLSEATDGAGAEYDVVFGVIIGTGTGAGVVAYERLLTGPNAIAGEWGHNPLPWPREDELPGPQCYCGRRGCMETWVSGSGLAADFRRAGGEALLPPEILKAALSGDQMAEGVLRRYEDRLARGLASVINVLDPDVIVLGGGLSNLQRLYQNVIEQWGQYVFCEDVQTLLRPAKHGDSSGVRGAAWLW